MMFTYWLPGHSHPMLLQSPLRCALSLGDLPADPFAQQFHHLEMDNGEMMASAHSFPLKRPTSKKGGNNKTIGQQQWREEEEEESTSQRKRRRNVGRRSIGTQTDAEEQQCEWISQIDEVDEEEMDDELANICAEIATQLLAMADRWEAQIKSRKEAAKRSSASNNGGGLWGWICAKLF